MFTRAILPLVLVMAMLANMACADDSTKLPSSKTSVVLPLLKKLSTTARPTLDAVEKILGPSHAAISMAKSLEFHYILDDKTEVLVSVYDRPSHEVISIVALPPGKKEETLYVRPINSN